HSGNCHHHRHRLFQILKSHLEPTGKGVVDDIDRLEGIGHPARTWLPDNVIPFNSGLPGLYGHREQVGLTYPDVPVEILGAKIRDRSQYEDKGEEKHAWLPHTHLLNVKSQGSIQAMEAPPE